MDYTIYLEFQKEHRIIKKKFEDDIKIKELFLDTFNDDKYFSSNIDNLDKLYFIKDNVLVNSNDTVFDKVIDKVTDIVTDNNNSPIKENIINIQCHIKTRGGGIIDDIIDPILGIVLMVFDPIVSPIGAIGKAFLFFIKAIFWLLKFAIWFVAFVVWIFLDLLNPANLIGDFYNSIMLVTITICRVPFELIMASFKICINILGGWMQGFWGWDMSNLTKNDKNSNYFKSFNRTAGQKIYYTQQNTIPFSIILGTILCPPMGVFMDLGTSGWLNIVVCCLLTLLFYIPGLCYALLIIYS